MLCCYGRNSGWDHYHFPLGWYVLPQAKVPQMNTESLYPYTPNDIGVLEKVELSE